ncbi:MAG: DUF3108 domain-containing protein [bacterium]|nr:DUF3108 domain-containing protein [bacterium]
MRMPLIALLAALAAAGHPAPLFSPGERLHYRGYVLGWIPVGDVWFDTSRSVHEGREAYRFDARALGRYVVYTLDIRLTSIVDAATLRSSRFWRREVGSEKREYEVIFDRERMEGLYRRKRGRFSTVEEMDAAPMDAGESFPIGPDVNDILFTLYFARDIGDRVGNARHYRFVEKDYVWKALVTVTEERRLDLGRAGAFDALRISIEPDYADHPDKREEFRGLFGVEGSLEVWVDKKTRIPLIVRGRVPFVYVLRPTVTVVLQDYHI